MGALVLGFGGREGWGNRTSVNLCVAKAPGGEAWGGWGLEKWPKPTPQSRLENGGLVLAIFEGTSWGAG